MPGGPWSAGTWNTGSWGESSGDIAFPTGVPATGVVGSSVGRAGAQVFLTGVQSQGQINNVQVFVGDLTAWGAGVWNNDRGWGGVVYASDLADGLQATAELGTVVARAGADVYVSGLVTLGSVGDEEIVAGRGWGAGAWSNDRGWGGITSVANSVVGVQGNGVIGVVTTKTVNNFQVNGVGAVGDVGTEFISGATNEEVFAVIGVGNVGVLQNSSKATVLVTGVEGTSQLGEEEVEANAFVQVTGVEAIGQLGEELAPSYNTWGGSYWGGPLGWGGITVVDVNVTGVEVTGFINSVGVSGSKNSTPAGVQATIAIGAEFVSGAANVTVTGVQAAGQLGEEDTSGDATVVITGIEATATLGVITTKSDNNILAIAVVAQGYIGETEESGDAVVVSITGVSGTGVVARPLVWGLIDTAQTPNWLPLAA